MPNAALPPGPVTGYNSAYGGVPTAPNPEATSLAAVLGNINNLANILALSKGTGAASADAARAQILKSLPQFDNLLSQFSTNVGAGARGELSPSTLANLNQKLAEYGTMTGSLGPATNAAALRAMGLTTEQVQANALDQMAKLTSLVPTGPAFNPASMFTTPGTQTELQWLANQLGSAPIPADARADELNRQLAGLRAGYNAGGGGTWQKPYSDKPRANVIPENFRPIGPGYIPPPATTSTTDPNATATMSSRTEEEWVNAMMDELDPVAAGWYSDPVTSYDPYYDSAEWNADMDFVTGMSDQFGADYYNPFPAVDTLPPEPDFGPDFWESGDYLNYWG